MAVINFPDPSVQTPPNTFSPTSTPDATSNGKTYKWTNGSWTITNRADNDAILPNPGGPDNQPGTLDDRYVKVKGSAMTGQLELPGGGSANEALQKQEIETLINSSDTAAGKYVRLAGVSVAQEITGTGGLKTAGLLESAGGIEVSGGGVNDITNGFYYANASLRALVNSSADGQDCTALSGLPYINHRVDIVKSFSAGFNVNSGSASEYRGFSIDDSSANDVRSDGKLYAFYSAFGKTGERKFTLFSKNNAPSYHNGYVYIGGDLGRNTFELWKSTLTEEQLEQYEAGTYVVPANVSTPGDGEFARSWYYNQQDEETQALLASGELEYPTHLTAATFTDTFDLGDNTNIDLRSDGRINLSGIYYKGGKTPSSVNYRGIAPRGSDGAIFINRGDDADDDVVSVIGRVDCRDADGVVANLGDISCFKADPPSGGRSDASAGTYQNWIGFDATNSQSTERFKGNKIGVRSSIGSWQPGSYNFYAGGEAPNYFKGLVESEGGVQVSGGIADGVNRKGIDIVELTTNVSGATSAAVYCETNAGPDDARNYNIYAGGTATNYFKGTVSCSSRDGQDVPDASKEVIEGAHVTPIGQLVSTANGGESGYSNLMLQTSADVPATNATGHYAVFWSRTTQIGGITHDGAQVSFNGVVSDYRLKNNIQELSNASERVKQLNPVTFNYTHVNQDKAYEGFIAHEIADVYGPAVTGIKDAIETYGTYTDTDGNVETNVVEPSVIPAGASFVAEGTRDVYQALDQTKLIPLLTKALQEALDKIETLETRLSDAGIA